MESQCRRRSLLSPLFSRLALVWVRQSCALYRSLSANIVREASSYLFTVPTVLIASNRTAYAFDPSTQQWSPFCRLTCMCGNGSMLNFVLMGPNRAIMILRNCTSSLGDLPYLAIWTQGKLQSFSDPQYFSALLYDEIRDVVYLFGEIKASAFSRLATNECKKYSPASRSFQPLPAMPSARGHCGSCWHLGLVYLCGGDIPGIDLFDPSSQTFTATFDFVCDLETDRNFFAVSCKGELLIVSDNYTWKRTGGEWRRQLRCKPKETMLFSSHPTVVLWQAKLYYSTWRESTVIDLVTGEEKKIPVNIKEKGKR